MDYLSYISRTKNIKSDKKMGMIRRTFGFREEIFKYCDENSISLQKQLRKLVESWHDKQLEERKKIDNYNKLADK